MTERARAGDGLCLLLIRASRPGRLTQNRVCRADSGHRHPDRHGCIRRQYRSDARRSIAKDRSQAVALWCQDHDPVRIGPCGLSGVGDFGSQYSHRVGSQHGGAAFERLTTSRRASARLSSQSQNLAQGASEQAQKIEEATAALEQMAEVTTRNTETAGKTDEVAKLAHAAATRGAADIGEMDSAIESSRQATILPRSSRPSTKSLSKPTFSL